MDNKRLILAIAISVAIMLGFQLLWPKPPAPPKPVATEQTAAAPKPAEGTAGPAAVSTAEAAVPREVPRLKIDAPNVRGSISLLGARFDDLDLVRYHETQAPDSPLVRLLEPEGERQPYYVQYGWSAAPGTDIKLPDNTTLWTASAPELHPGAPVTLSWDNGAGLVFSLVVSIDQDFMFTVEQGVRNTGTAPVALFPYARIRRDYKPATAGYSQIHEGPIGVFADKLNDSVSYDKTKSEGLKNQGVAFKADTTGGWAGITDKYWLVALVPPQNEQLSAEYRYVGADGRDKYQVDYLAQTPQTVAPGATTSLVAHLFAGAKEVHVLDHYQAEYGIPIFYKAVDFGWFYFITYPMFLALDWLNRVLGNFGLAILAFTVFVKALFFPLANRSYRSMSRMRMLAPKMQVIRERFKDDPQKLQAETMALYKAEKVNPVSGCLPMVIQIPVFFSLYKNILVTIEMRHAPFVGWIHDLSETDPTNVFNLFGLLPFDPTVISPYLHLGVWPLIMGITMFCQQMLNPAPPDPVQARLFKFMPIIFTFMMARFPAGLVIYWSWNNLLSIAQQWVIMRRTKLPKPALAKT